MNTTAKPTPRSIVVKALFSPDEFVEFNRECTDNDVSHSKTLRDLAKGWIARQRKDKQQRDRREWPAAGQNMAMFLPGRGNYAMPKAFNLRM